MGALVVLHGCPGSSLNIRSSRPIAHRGARSNHAGESLRTRWLGAGTDVRMVPGRLDTQQYPQGSCHRSRRYAAFGRWRAGWVRKKKKEKQEGVRMVLQVRTVKSGSWDQSCDVLGTERIVRVRYRIAGISHEQHNNDTTIQVRLRRMHCRSLTERDRHTSSRSASQSYATIGSWPEHTTDDIVVVLLERIAADQNMMGRFVAQARASLCSSR